MSVQPSFPQRPNGPARIPGQNDQRAPLDMGNGRSLLAMAWSMAKQFPEYSGYSGSPHAKHFIASAKMSRAGK